VGVSTPTFLYSTWTFSDHHTAVNLAFLLGELVENTFIKPLKASAALIPSFFGTAIKCYMVLDK
jgi:hypothetical protein